MDLIKIGRYIAGKRKDLGMTQKQLAETSILYNEEQGIVALIYDNDDMHVPDLPDLMDETDLLSQNDYVYYFSVEFCK